MSAEAVTAPVRRGVFVTGTDTGVGKTVAAAWLVRALDGDYWKPVQAGLDGETDVEAARRLAGLSPERTHEPAYLLKAAVSPHEAARREGMRIDLRRFALPQTRRPLVVEGAGGVLVPLNDNATMADLMARLGLPVVVVARTSLGTINHTLLSLEALRGRGVAIAGVVLNGPPCVHNRHAIEDFGRTRIVAELPLMAPLNARSVADAARRIRPALESAKVTGA